MCAVYGMNVSIQLKKSLLIGSAETLQILVTNDLACAAFPAHVVAAPAWLQGLVLNKKSLFSNLLHSITHCLASVTFPHY